MKPQITTLIIALVVGYIGGLSSQIFTSKNQHATLNDTTDSSDPFDDPYFAEDESDDIIWQLGELQKKVSSLEAQLNSLATQETENSKSSDNKKARSNRTVTPNKTNLLSAGVNSDIADEVLRRISQQEFKRLELQNLIQRGGPDVRLYRNELRELNRNRISLRTELGDDTYDQYLYESGQNNRVKVSSVMADSPAELAGFQADDVILHYDTQKILSWSDIRSATTQGEIGSYTSIEILRDGSRMNLMVPTGTLGVQLDPVQLNPAE